MPRRQVLESYEAHLEPVFDSRSRARGRFERERYADGVVSFDIAVRHLLVDDTTLSVVVNGWTLGSFELRHGGGRLRRSSDASTWTPEVSSGDVVEVLDAGRTLMRGTLELD